MFPEVSRPGGLAFAGIVLTVADLAATRARVASAGASDRPDRLTVPLDPAGTAFIAFEESPA